MTLRTRIAVTAAVAVAVAFMVAAAGLYLATARTLRGEVDHSLGEIAAELTDHPPGRRMERPPGPRMGYLGGPGGYVQYVDASGQVLGASGDDALPHDDAVAAVAAGTSRGFLSTVRLHDEPLRVLTIPLVSGVAAQIARPLSEVEASLAVLRNRLALSAVLAIALATGLGMLVARRAVGPVRQLTALAEQVAATGDLSRRIELTRGHRDGRRWPDARRGPDGTTVGAAASTATPATAPTSASTGDDAGTGDELDRLARTFNTMLANLEQARLAQQQLVADASHELRTPLTSLRTNIEVLTLDAGAGAGAGAGAAGAGLSVGDRRRLLDDLTVQLDEFGRLVSALVELARGAQPATATTPVQLDELVEAAADRARAFAGDGQKIAVSTTPVVVAGESDRLDRAVANLLDNAIKYGAGRPIEVGVSRRDGARPTAVVSVRDGGAGIAADDMPRVFERFYRAPSARSAAGSGLGLAIVKQVVEAHGGHVMAGGADGGGTVMTITLPAHA